MGEAARDVGACVARVRGIQAIGDVLLGAPREATDEHHVEDYAELVDVRAHARRRAEEALRRHVRRRAADASFGRGRRRPVVDVARDAEIEEHRRVVDEDDVLRLHVAVHHPGGVERVHGAREDREVTRRDRARAADRSSERSASVSPSSSGIARYGRPSGRSPDSSKRHEARCVETLHALGLGEEAPPLTLGGRELGAEDLQRDRSDLGARGTRTS